jgi:hypothetical protein
MVKKKTLLLVATLFAVTLAGPLRAATDVLDLVPDKALAVVVVNRIGATSGKLEKLSQLVKAPLPGPLALLKKTVGLEQGLDEQGSTILAIMAPDGSIMNPRPMAFVPVSDYAKFVAQLGGDGSQEITELTVGDQQILASRKGDFAVLVDANGREMLAELLKADDEVSPAITPLTAWLTKNDVAAAVLPRGIQLGLDAAIEGLDTIKQIVASQQSSGPQAEQMALAFDMYGQMFKFCRGEIDVAAVGIRIDDDGNMRIGERLHFLTGGKLAKLPDGGGVAPTKLLQGLPADDFVFVGGGSWSPELTEAMMQWSLGLMKSNSKMYGLEEISDAQMEKLMETSMASMKEIKAMGFRVAPGQVGDPVYSDLLFTMRMPDSSEFLANYRKYIASWNDMTRDAKGPMAMKFDVADATIAGQKALQLTMDMGQVMTAQIQDNPEAMKVLQPMIGKIFGDDGKMKITLVQIDGTTVVSGIGSEPQITRAVKLMRSGAAGADGSASIGKTARLLPETVGFTCFMSPRGAVAWVSRLLETFLPSGTAPKIPPMPETAPIGFAARLGPDQLETETVVPAETLEAIGGYIEQLRQ